MKTQCLVIAAVLLGFTNPDTSAAADTGVRITVTIRGAASEADAVVLRKTLGGIKGIMVKAESIKAGKKGRFRHYFSPPFVIAIADINKTDIGAIAAKERVARADTPSRVWTAIRPAARKSSRA